ncbi:MAG: type II toxin-antitoxin system RelB/DinJ family antitoxin [Monoglobaceae bacterium]
MAKTSNIFARVEPTVKEQAEVILEQLGVPMSNAINMFLRQVVLQKGIPFEMKLPKYQMVDMSTLTEEQFNAEIEMGMQDVNAGRIISAQSVAERMNQEYGI